MLSWGRFIIWYHQTAEGVDTKPLSIKKLPPWCLSSGHPGIPYSCTPTTKPTPIPAPQSRGLTFSELRPKGSLEAPCAPCLRGVLLTVRNGCLVFCRTRLSVTVWATSSCKRRLGEGLEGSTMLASHPASSLRRRGRNGLVNSNSVPN